MRSSLVVLWGSFLPLLVSATSLGQIKPAKDAPQPLSPEKSQQRFRLPADLQIELVASEPLISDPSHIAFDERGRMFVCELHGYNLDGHEEIVQLNKTGKLDRKIRRIRTVSAQSKKAAEQGTYGTVKRLVDRNGDGRADSVEIWADRLPPCYGIIPARGGLIVICAPDIVYLADRDNDGRAEVRETLFSGFQVRVLERAINNPRWGPDNWIYVAAGGGGGLIRGPKLKQPVQIGHTDFRIKADGSAIEPVSGTTSTFGMTQNAFGERFLVAGGPCSYVVPLPYRYLVRNPHVPSPQSLLRVGHYRRLFPRSQPHPWRVSRSRNPAWVKFYGQRETTPNGYFTSQCGQLLYLAEDLPTRYQGNYFICDPSQNLIHRAKLEPARIGYRLARFAEEKSSEFLTSTDQWFRPMNLQLGPRGNIYVIDMYREIIEDFSAIPRDLQQQYGLVQGKDHGRIWRIRNRKSKPRASKWPAQMSAQELVAQLSNPSRWWRQTAQRQLIERRLLKAKSELAHLVRQSKVAAARMHGLYALSGLGVLSAEVIDQALTDAIPQVRVHALRLSEPFLAQSPRLQKRLGELVDDPSHLVRVQLALTLGEWRSPRATKLIALLAREYSKQTWMTGAILSSVGDRMIELIPHLSREPAGLSSDFVRLLASSVGSRKNQKEVELLLQTAALRIEFRRKQSATSPRFVLDLLDGVYAGLRRGKLTVRNSRRLRAVIQVSLLNGPKDTQRRALQIAQVLKLPEGPAMRRIWAASLQLALDRGAKTKERLEAIELLGFAPPNRRHVLAQLLRVNERLPIQLETVKVLSVGDGKGKGKGSDSSALLLRNYPALSPAVQAKILDAHFARKEHIPGLLQAIQNKLVPVASIAAVRREQLIKSRDRQVSALAKKLFADRIDAGRSQVVARFRASLALRPNINRGQMLFGQHCSKCHRVLGAGSQVGPDLRGIKNRANASLLIDLFDPSRRIKPGYRTFVVTMNNGRVYTGLLAEESATSVTVKKEKGETVTLLRKNIEQMRSSSVSLMPSELEKQLKPQDVADILGYLKARVLKQ